MKKLTIVFAFLTIFFSGCSSVGVQNTREAKLMPKPVAEKILAKYFGEAWVKNPRGFYSQGFGSLCGDNGWGSLPYSEINILRSFSGSKLVRLEKTNWALAGIPCQLMAYQISLTQPISQSDLEDIADALVSLGAKIDEISKPN